jgi:hypothetical protein
MSAANDVFDKACEAAKYRFYKEAAKLFRKAAGLCGKQGQRDNCLRNAELCEKKQKAGSKNADKTGPHEMLPLEEEMS